MHALEVPPPVGHLVVLKEAFPDLADAMRNQPDEVLASASLALHSVKLANCQSHFSVCGGGEEGMCTVLCCRYV